MGLGITWSFALSLTAGRSSLLCGTWMSRGWEGKQKKEAAPERGLLEVPLGKLFSENGL